MCDPQVYFTHLLLNFPGRPARELDTWLPVPVAEAMLQIGAFWESCCGGGE